MKRTSRSIFEYFTDNRNKINIITVHFSVHIYANDQYMHIIICRIIVRVNRIKTAR